MRRRGVLVWVLALAAMLAVGPRAGRGADETVTDQEVLAAIKKGVDYLINAKNNDNWEEPGKNWVPSEKQMAGKRRWCLMRRCMWGESMEDVASLIPRGPKDLKRGDCVDHCKVGIQRDV